MTLWNSHEVESANSFYWKTVLHRLYDRIVPYHPLQRHNALDHVEKLEEIELWMDSYKKEVDRIKKNRHLLLGTPPAQQRWERGVRTGVSLPEQNEIEVVGTLRGDDGTEIELEDVPLFVPYEKKPRRRRRGGRAVTR